MLLSVSNIVILFRNSAVLSSTPIPVDGSILCPMKYLAPTIFPVSTVQISFRWAVLLLSGEYGALSGSYPVIFAGDSTLSIKVFCRLAMMALNSGGVEVSDIGQYAAFTSSSI